MKVLKELVVRYEDGTKYEYSLGIGGYHLEEREAHLKLWKNGCTYYTHYLDEGVKEYFIRSEVASEGGASKAPVDDTEALKEVRIFFPNNPEVVYKNVTLKTFESLETFEDRVEISGDKVFAVFLLRDISGWEVRDQ